MISGKTGFFSYIEKTSKVNQNKPAVYNGDGQYATYKDVISIYNSAKTFFNNEHIKPYVRMSVVSDNDIYMGLLSFIIMEFAVLAPIDFSLNIEKYTYFLKLLNIDCIITDKLSGSGYEAAKQLGLGIILFKPEGEKNQRGCSYEIIQPITYLEKPPTFKRSDYTLIGTTSGTTSTPKIVPTTASSNKASRIAREKVFDFVNTDVTLVITKSWKSSSISALTNALCSGGTTILANGFAHLTFLDQLKKYKVTLLTATPAVLRSLVDYIDHNYLSIGKCELRFIRSSGAPLQRKLKEHLENIFKTQVIQSYGMTETKNITCTIKATKGYKEGSAGISSGLKIKIVDNEILVKGDSVFEGYENNEQSNEIYFTDGWFHTGDMGYLDEDGYIFITGRIKEMINRGGEKVSPYEIENAIISNKNITDIAVFPYPNSYGSEDVGAVITLNSKETMTLVELRSYLEGKVSPYKMPTRLYITKEIPKSENNKVQRKKLYELLSKQYPDSLFQKRSKSRKEVINKTEKIIKRIFTKVLKQRNISITEKYTDLGGDSLNGAIVLADIESKFAVRVPVNILFEGGTIHSIAAFVSSEKEKGNDFSFLVPIKATGTKKPLICAHSGIGDAVTYRHIGKHMEADRPVYALRFDMKKEKWPQPLTFDYLSRKYVEEIRRLQPEGPYYLLGNCWGGVLAFKIASVLLEDNCQVGLLAMLDSAKKDIDKYSVKKSHRLLRRMYKTFIESFDQLKGRPLKKKIPMIIKKTRNIFTLIRITQTKKLYRFAYKKNIKILMRITGKTGALGYAYQKYRPEKLPGTLYFFKATLGHSAISKSHEYWAKMAKDFNLVEISCHHNDLVIGETSEKLTDLLSVIMEETNDKVSN